VPRVEVYDQVELRLKPARMRPAGLPRLVCGVATEAAPGGELILPLALSVPTAGTRWQVEAPKHWRVATEPAEDGSARCRVTVPPTAAAGRHEIKVRAKLPNRERLSARVWLSVGAPLELSLRVPPHADTLSRRTKAVVVLQNRLPIPAVATLAVTAPEGWGVEPATAQVTLPGSGSVSTPAWIETPAGVKPGFFELGVEATVPGQAPVRVRSGMAVVGDFLALRCPQTAAPPRLDGKLDDACWSGAPAVTAFVRNDGKGPAGQQTRAWVAYDAKALYVALDCRESQPETVVALVNQDGGEVWRDDSAEVFLDPEHGHQKLTQFVVNTLGNRTPGSGWDAAVGRTPTGWVMEVAIPFAGSPPQPGDMWGLNLCRTRPSRPQAEPEFSSWVCTEGSFHRPEKFGHLVFGP
jgi:hypothetical protein